MPGQGEIGGGSCCLDFKIGPKNNPHTTWHHDDTDQACPFTLTIEVYKRRGKRALKSVKSGKYTLVVKRGDRVKLAW